MSIKNLLIEMKNMSELMVDLAYSAVLFNSIDAAEEVLTLENRVNAMNYEIKKESLVAARSYEDAEKLTALLEIAEAAESMANAAKDLADLVIKGITNGLPASISREFINKYLREKYNSLGLTHALGWSRHVLMISA